MIESQASRTAMMVAGYRARASEREDAICSDPWAAQLAGEEGIALSHRFDESFPHMELWMALRTAYLDEQVRHWARHFDQVVLLGAGLDTRAARLGVDARFFEVDHPATQAHKREQLAAIDGYPVDAATFAPCDFEREDFLDQLVSVGFDAGAPAVIVWEGVVPYLTEPAVRATLRRVADGCEPSTVLLFDYIMKRMVHSNDLPEKDLAVREMVESLGEPVRFGVNEPVELLYEEGFRHVRAISFNEMCLSFTGTYVRERAFRFQHIALASRVAHSML